MLGILLAVLGVGLATVLVVRAARAWGQERSARELNGLLQSVPDGMLIVDGRGRILLVNGHLEEIFGYEPGELIGMPVEILVGHASRPGHVVLRDAYIAAPTARRMGERQAVFGKRKDGTPIPVEISLSPIETGGDTVFCAVVRDATERRQTELAIHAAREFAERIIETIPDGMLVADAHGKVVLVNARTEELFGYERAELLGRPVEILVPAAVRGRHPALRNGYATTPRLRSMADGLSLSGQRKDGSEVPIEISLSPIVSEEGMLSCAVIRDVTERRRQEEAVREARALAESIVETIHQPLVVLDAGLRVEHANGAFHATFDVSAERAHGRLLAELGCGEWRIPELQERLSEIARQGGELHAFEVEQEWRNLGIRTMSLSARPIRRGGADTRQILLAIEDVTDRKRAVQFLAEREALERTNRELQEFAYVASHDLQEPLRKIQAFGDRLRSSYAASLPAEAADFIERMRGAAARMTRLIDDLLTFSRVTTGAQTFAPVDLNAIANEVLADLEVRVEEVGGRVELGALPTIEGDPTQLRQLLQNLVANALKFHRPDVPPVVILRGRLLRTKVKGRRRALASVFRLEVADNGIGFEEKYLDRIFTIFQRLHGRSAFEGTGLGLAICRKIVERHRGHITATSTPGVGSTFIVTVPVRQTDEVGKEELHERQDDGPHVAHGG